MTIAEVTVFVVDDDASFRRAVQRLLHSIGLSVETFASAQEFLRRETPTSPSCLVLDVRMPEVNGLQLQELLATAKRDMPIIFLSGHATVPTSVRAMKAGAVDFLQKPCDDEVLLEAIYRALHHAQQAWRDHAEQHTLYQRLEALTPREREVLALVIGQYLSCRRKLDCVIIFKAGFQTQLRASPLSISCGMSTLGMARQICDGRLQGGIQPDHVSTLQGLDEGT